MSERRINYAKVLELYVDKSQVYADAVSKRRKELGNEIELLQQRLKKWEEWYSKLSAALVYIGASEDIKRNVDVDELKSWVKDVNDNPGMGRPKDIGAPFFPCATIMMPMVSYGSFGGYKIKPIGDRKFIQSDAFYLILAALEACGMRLPDWGEDRVEKFCAEIAADIESGKLPHPPSQVAGYF